ncbi:uncharacterized protein isoform X1 [Leptinotarsa decemlineata]|uniref:uncharacterized protein isoform X1 n=2 Tax=Leptinotarsa decemlineata TaxID=7539 RepID=UPI003D30D0AC
MSKNHEFLKSSRIKDEIFIIMRPDDISLVAKNDPLICLYGEALLNKHKRKQIAIVISNKMREMGRLLIALKMIKIDSIGLFDTLKPENFQSFVSATKVISGYKPNDKSFVAPSLAMHMETNLKFVCNIALKIVLENRKIPKIQWTDRQQKKTEIKDFKKLIEGHWCNEISSLALKALKEKHWEKPIQLPLNSDIQLINKYINQHAEDAYIELTHSRNVVNNFKKLTECVFAETIMFNRKRIGEIQYLTIQTYNLNTDTINQESFMDSLTKVEQLISKRFKRVVAGGKGSKPVPILFSRKLQKYIDCILSFRREFDIVPETNPYLFANPASVDRWMSGASILRKFAQKSGAKEPSLLTSTKFRKHIATTLQLMSMEENEMEQIATFMGHTKKTHLEFYRLPQDIYQTAKVAKILLLLEKGKGKEFKGRSLNDIELDSDVYYTTDSEREKEESNNVLSEKIFNKITKRTRRNHNSSEGDMVNNNVQKNIKLQPLQSECNSNDSSDEEQCAVSRKKLKKTVAGRRTKWSEREKKIVMEYFKEHVRNKKAPKKHECTEFLTENKNIFTDKNWVQIKTFVYNCYRTKK